MSLRPENSVHPWLVERVDTCTAPWTTAMVDHEGDVHPCCISHRVIGDLRTASFEAIWNGDAARQLRWFLLHGLIHPICRGIACPYVRNSLAAGEPAEWRAAVEAELDEEDYCARYPDVVAAIARGEFRNAREHFQCFGREECRMARFHLDRVTPPAAPVPVTRAAEEWPGASADHWVFRFDERAYRAAYRDAYGVEFSLLNGYGDRPDWVVRRGDREFRYHDNMADRDLPNVRHHLLRALAEGGRLGMPVRLRMLAEEREKLDLHQEGYC